MGDQEKSVPHCWEGVSPLSGTLRRFEFFAWWTRSQSIRTEGEVPFEVTLFFQTEPPTYQKVADKAMHLSQLGMNPNRIAIALNVARSTVVRALRWIKGKPAGSL